MVITNLGNLGLLFSQSFVNCMKKLVVVSWFHNTVICFVLHHYAGSFPLAPLNTDIERWSAGDLFWISTWSANKGNTKIDKFHQNICKSSGQGLTTIFSLLHNIWEMRLPNFPKTTQHETCDTKKLYVHKASSSFLRIIMFLVDSFFTRCSQTIALT